ncbi:hypothetical protein VMCG_07982 [Cytospora schulzeri]|uniref:Uncharacterized protein n=1 Tax=Cytospora schulzeri TaxID=448051 RepID=A0A423VXY5_9PEZI|nr:hypothetical protein VMCG_07982 [Valsa malicola]
MSVFDSSNSRGFVPIIQKILDDAARAQKDLRSTDDLFDLITEELGKAGSRYLDTLTYMQCRDLLKEYQGRCNVYRSDHHYHASMSTGNPYRVHAAPSHGAVIDGDSGYGDPEARSPSMLVDRSSNTPYPYFSKETAFDVHLIPDPDQQEETTIKTAKYDGTSLESYIDEEEARGLCQSLVGRDKRVQVHWCIDYQGMGKKFGHTNCIIANQLENVNIVFGANYNSREPESGPGPAADEELTHGEGNTKGMYKHLIVFSRTLAEEELKSRPKRALGNGNEDPRKKQKI